MKKLFFLFALASLTACSKDPSSPPPNPNPIDSPVALPPKAYSYWKVGNDSFKSNNVRKDIGKVTAILSGPDFSNGFFMRFHFGALPNYGDFPLSKTAIHHPDSVEIGFYYKQECYIPCQSENNVLHRDTGTRFLAHLPPTFFMNCRNPSDTIFISGLFREP